MGYIYKHINKINGKIYIGQTTQKPQRRFHNGTHYIKSRGKITEFGEDIIKYGWHNFEHVILEECDNEKLDERERFYIYEYSKKDKLYNIQKGGKKFPICAVDRKDGKVYLFNSANSAEKKLGINHSNIAAVCKRKMRYAKGYYFCYLEDYYPSFYNDMLKKRTNGVVSIIGINIGNGTQIEFNSFTDAELVTGINHGNISECCRGRRKQAGGYKWMYKEDYYVTNTRS